MTSPAAGACTLTEVPEREGGEDFVGRAKEESLHLLWRVLWERSDHTSPLVGTVVGTSHLCPGWLSPGWAQGTSRSGALRLGWETATATWPQAGLLG